MWVRKDKCAGIDAVGVYTKLDLLVYMHVAIDVT